MSHGRSDTISARISSSNDDDILSFGADIIAVLVLRIQQRFRI